MSNKHRRKSLSILRPSMTGLTPINEPSTMLSSPLSSDENRPGYAAPSSPVVSSPVSPGLRSQSPSAFPSLRARGSMERLMHKAKPRNLAKSARPHSIFGSFRGSGGSPGEDETGLKRTASATTSIHSLSDFHADLAKGTILLNGEVQTASGMFRKRSQYLVLTDTHLVKFRSQTRASEVFSSIPPSSYGKASGARHARLSSNGSNHDTHSGEGIQAIPLNQIVASYPLDDGKPYFSIEISHLDEEIVQASSTVLQLQDPKDQDLWLSSLRGAVTAARLKDPSHFSESLVTYTARALEQDRDYHPSQFYMFRVVQRAGRSLSRSSSDDLAKLTSNVCILAIGQFKVHVLPLPRSFRTGSSNSLVDLNSNCYGLASLTSLSLQDDDAFQIVFRTPLRPHITLSLASSCASDIALYIRRVADWIRPLWLEQPFTWHVPEAVHNYEENLSLMPSDDSSGSLERTLAAYSAAYSLDASRFRYSVIYECQDAPVFSLHDPEDGRKYGVLELLAVFRALRYCEAFITISFQGVDLTDLQRLKDVHGHDHVPWTTRSGEPLNQPEQAEASLLVQELQALALKSRKLRRLDFTNCISTRSQSSNGLREDVGTGICEALLPLCIRQLTNVDWIVLNGIKLAENDVDYIFSAAIEQLCHLRAIEIGSCGLEERTLLSLLNALSHQSATLESIDVSGNLARIEPTSLQRELLPFKFLRKLNLSRLSRTSTLEPLLRAQDLMSWRLEDLRLSKTVLNEASIDSLAAYLQSNQSGTLRLLDLSECQVTGGDVAVLFESLDTQPNSGRNLRMCVSGNQLEKGHEALVKAIRRDKCPSQLVMTMIDYQEESNFDRLLDALARNTTITYLDFSGLSLPLDASETTCQTLRRVFSLNTVLEYLDISGEQTHIMASTLGTGLNIALEGLGTNVALKTLRIENQTLGLQGASTLASALERNTCLQELLCEGNEMSLQAFTVLVRGVEHNKTLRFVPDMRRDQIWTQARVGREIDHLRKVQSNDLSRVGAKMPMRRSLGRTVSGQKSSPQRLNGNTGQSTDMQGMMDSLAEQWEAEVERLHSYLARNADLAEHAANGLDPDEQPNYLQHQISTGPSLEVSMRGIDLNAVNAAPGPRLKSTTSSANGSPAKTKTKDRPDIEVTDSHAIPRDPASDVKDEGHSPGLTEGESPGAEEDSEPLLEMRRPD